MTRKSDVSVLSSWLPGPDSCGIEQKWDCCDPDLENSDIGTIPISACDAAILQDSGVQKWWKIWVEIGFFKKKKVLKMTRKSELSVLSVCFQADRGV